MSAFERLKIEIYGESHAPRIGLVLGGIPVGTVFAKRSIDSMLCRRMSGSNAWSTPRKEEDKAVFARGVSADGDSMTVTGDIEAYIENLNVKPQDYSNVSTVPRPSHADYVSFVRYGRIPTGGGKFSGRLTAMLCVAGGIAKDMLAKCGISVNAYISEIGGVATGSYADSDIELYGLSDSEKQRLENSSLPLLDAGKECDAVNEIKTAAADGDSVGGVIECVISGLRAGELGDSLFDGLEGKIAYSVYGVPAVKGVEFGRGFNIANMRGSEANDSFAVDGKRVVTKTNDSGGINGGISNGMPVTLRVAIRPTPSISKTQTSVELTDMSECSLNVKGRHDACIVPRAVPCIESAVCIALLDEVLKQNGKNDSL